VIRVNNVTFDMTYYVKMLRFYGVGGNPQSDRLAADQVVEAIQTSELVAQLADKLGIAVTTAELDWGIKNLISGPDKEEEFQELYQKQLQRWKLSDEEFRRIVKSELLRQKLREEYIEPMVPKEAQQVHARGILVDTEEEAKEVVDRLNAGEDFAALAKELSQYPSEEEGGDMGWLPRSIVGAEFDRVAFSIKPNTISDPISDEVSGYWVIEVLERDAPDEERVIDETSRGMLVSDKYNQWFSEQMESNVLESYLDAEKVDWAIKRVSKD
jgi:foldase protein PrsA